MNLNPSQLRAVSCGSGPCLVLAGPGSGKTTVIIRRIQHLINVFNIRPANILAVTFSRSAAGEMAERFGRGDVSFATLHSICLKILKEEMPGVKVISLTRQYAFLRSEVIRYRIPYESMDTICRELVLKISRLKSASGNAAAGASDMTFLRIFSDYCLFMNESGLLDFDDMVSECRKLFMLRPDVLSKWQERFQYILVDEFQDISPLQYDVICQLGGDAANVFAVGDDDQGIYTFRGADGGIMQRFLDDHPNATRITLDVNYRCGEVIQAAAGQVISGCESRFEKAVVPVRSGGALTISSFASRREEYRSIIAEIRKLNSPAGADCAGGDTLPDIAVLFRTNDDSLLFSKMLRDAGIAFTGIDALGGQRYDADLFPVQDIQAYLNIAANLKSGSAAPCREEFLRVINRPERYIHRDSLRFHGTSTARACLESMKHFYRGTQMSTVISKLEQDLLLIADLPLSAAIKYIRFAIGYDKWLMDYANEHHRDADRLLVSLDCYSGGGDGGAGGDAFPAVSILTMHAAKGKEFDVVFLPDSNEGVIPVKRSVKEGLLDEERRLYYVAMTRARDALHISWVTELHNKAAVPSRFIRDLDQ